MMKYLKMIKIPNLIFAFILLSLPIFAQESNRQFGWDLTYSSVLETNKIGSRAWIRKWLASDYQAPAKKWISEWQGEPITSSILIEYASFAHAGEHTTMWLFRTKDHAYYWQDIEDTKFSDIKKDLKLEVYDKLLTQISSWRQAKPNQPKQPQSIPGYLGFLSIYDKDKSRQMLLSEEDFLICKTKKCNGVNLGRLMLALRPVLFREGEEDYRHKSEAELAAITPNQRVDEYLKEMSYHRGDSIPNYTNGRDQREVIYDYIMKDGVKALTALAEIANRYNPDIEEDIDLASDFSNAFYLAGLIDNNVIRIRATEEGRSAIKVFEDVLNRMKKAGFADENNRWNNDYSRELDILRILQGKELSFRDTNIRDTLREKHKIQISDEEMIKFSHYLTLLDPTYPGRCDVRFPPLPLICKDSKEYYEAYLKFKAEISGRLFLYEVFRASQSKLMLITDVTHGDFFTALPSDERKRLRLSAFRNSS